MTPKTIFITIFFVLGFFLLPALVKAAPCGHHNVFGWAWSENIGWLSFSCENTIAIGAGNDYGVDISVFGSSGSFSGYAWSEHIGWVDFAPAGPYPAIGPSYSACVNLPGVSGEVCEADLAEGQVGGWAKILSSNSWLRLRDTLYGVYIDSATGEFHDWAWSDDYGWLSFNCADAGSCGGGADYWVETDIFGGVVPSKPTNLNVDLDDSAYCESETNYCGIVIPPFSWTSDPGTGYEIWLDEDDSSVSSPEFRYISSSGSVSGVYEFRLTPDLENLETPGLGYYVKFSQTYYWKVRVRNAVGWSEWSNSLGEIDSFATDAHAWPCPNLRPFSFGPAVNEVVNFIQNAPPSESLCYNGGEHLCQSDVNAIYDWDLGNGKIPDVCNIDPQCRGNATTTYDVSGMYTVELEITDNSPLLPFSHGICSSVYNLGVGLPYPIWREVRPR